MKKAISIFMTVIFAIAALAIPVSAASAKISAPSSISVKAKTESTVKLSWKSVKNATKYTIYYSTDKKTYKKYGSTSKTTVTVKKLTADTTYYFKLKATGKVDGKSVKSAYSKVKSAKTAEAAVKESSSEKTVYTTKTGHKYHTTLKCEGLNNADMKKIRTWYLSEIQAETDYKPCTRCA